MPSLPALTAGRFALVLVVSVLAFPGRSAHAQDDTAVEEVDVAPSASTPTTRARVASDPSTEELPEGASSGPSLAERQAAARRGEVIGRPTGPDPNDPDLPVSLLLMIGGGGIVTPGSLDLALRSHDYGTPAGVLTADATLTGRVLDWLWLGGRFGGRARFYTRNDGPGAQAAAFDLLAVVQTRFQLGRIVELGVMVGAGAAYSALLLQSHLSGGVWPRVTGAAHIGLRVAHGARIVLRFAWDYCTVFDLDGYGSDLELGGPSGAIGFEVRT